MNRATATSSLALALVLGAAAFAQPPAAPDPAVLRGESTQTRKRLAESEQKLLNGKAADAADELQRALDESGSDLIAYDKEDSRQLKAARWVIHSLLAKLPPDVLKAYQDRIDQPAKKLLDQAKRDRDPRPLWELLDRYFVSRPGDEALLLLGDLLFERGEFRAAESAWRRLLPDASADVAYPGSKADLALVRARVALAVIFQGDIARAKAELTALKATHPGATGTLAGKTGPLADVLQTFLDSRPKLAPEAGTGFAWLTYGGDPGRAGRVPGGIPNAWPSRPSWREAAAPDRLLLPAPGQKEAPIRPPFGYPVIAGGEVFVASGGNVLAFDLRTGRKTRKDYRPNAPFADSHCTLTAADGLLYARIGPPVVRPPRQQEGSPALELPSSVVCLSLRDEGKFTELWKLYPPEDAKVATAWEGVPLVSGRRLWAVYAKFEGGRVIHVAACYDPADSEKPPARPAWAAELCDSPLPASGPDRVRQELLTLAGRNLIFCSNSGAVVAVDAATGRRAWGFRYPRSRKAVSAPTGDPAPAVAFGGRVFVAPADGERVYALDANTGRLLWESGPTEGARILGVSRGRLIVAASGPVRSIRGLDLETGSTRDGGGWLQATDVLSHGQGLVTDDTILWPTRDGLFVLDPRTGKRDPNAGTPNPLPSPLKGHFGHVAYADGVLVVVTPTHVCGYRAQSLKIETKPDATPLERFGAKVDRAEDELAAGRPDRARAILAEVASGDLPPPFRAWAAARMLQLAPPATELNRLPAQVREVLNPAIMSEWVLPPDGVPVTLDEFLRRKLGRSPAPGSVPAFAEAKWCEPALTGDAAIDRTLKLPHAVSPLRPIPGGACPKRLFASGPRTLLAIPIDRSAEAEFAPADLFTHAADVAGGFVAAGPFAVALYGTAREPEWVFRVPLTGRLPDGPSAFRFRSDGEPETPHLSSFVLAGSWLLARIGDDHLVALDLHAKRVAWVLGASGQAGYEPGQLPGAPRFGPHFAVCGQHLIVQLSGGKRWFVTLATGRPVAMPALGERTAENWWPHSPMHAGDGRVLFADGPGLVRLAQLGGRVKWSFEPESAEGYTGEPAQARVWCNALLVAVRRNHGVEIERVNLSDGKSAWPDGAAFIDADRIDLFAADADAERVYVPTGNKLRAISLTSGKSAWEAKLPPARGWVVRAGKSCVIAYPAEAIPAAPPDDAWARVRRSFAREPLVWRLPGLAATLYDAWVRREAPVLLFDPETGKPLARIDLPARGPAVTAHFDADAAVIATGARVVWIK